MKKTILLVFLFGIIYQSFSQKEDANWILGYGPRNDTLTQSIYQIPFGDSLIVEQKNIRFYMDVTNDVISHGEGNLICYTNGTFLNNGDHQQVANGGGFQDEEQLSLIHI